MKVRALIEQLEKLDRDCNIFIQYDGCYLNEPDGSIPYDNDPCNVTLPNYETKETSLYQWADDGPADGRGE